MEGLKEQIEALRKKNALITLANTKGKHNQEEKNNNQCNICNGTYFIASEKGFKRCECYHRELSIKSWSKFGINADKLKKLKDFETDTPIREKAKSEAIRYIKEFNKLGDELNICFLGQAGAGKTYLITSIGANLLKSGACDSVIYMPYVEVMKELKALSMDDKKYSEAVEKYITAKLLIIDDLFKDKIRNGELIGSLTEADIKHIYPIINQRYMNDLPTVYSSECSPQMLYTLDEALTGRILEKSRVIIFKKCIENNYRMKRFI